jgi:hypothetical protein
VDGRVRFFLSDPGRIDEARTLADSKIKAIVATQEFLFEVGTGLIKITLLDDNLPLNNVDAGIQNTVDGEAGTGTLTFVVMAIGSAALIAFVGSVYYWKRDGEVDGAATQAAGSSMVYNENDQVDQNRSRSSSPFSEMLPSAYRFNDNMSILTSQGGLSPLVEDEASLSRLSPCLFGDVDDEHPDDEHDTSSRSFDMPRTIFAKEPDSPEILGARKRAGGAMTAGLHLSGIDIDNSESDMSIDNNDSTEEHGMSSIDNNSSTEAEEGLSSFAACNPFEALTLLGGTVPTTPAKQDLDLLFDTGLDEEKDQKLEIVSDDDDEDYTLNEMGLPEV